MTAIDEHRLVEHESGWDHCATCHLDWPCRPAVEARDAELEALRTVVRLLVERFHDDTPMGPNVIDLPAVRWRILPPTVAGAVQRALAEERS